MSLIKSFAMVGALVAASAVQTVAGTVFRLEIGPPIAAGTGNKVLKDAKKAVFAVRAVVCDDLAAVRISGTAERIHDGVRQSVPITLTEVDKAQAIYLVGQQWPEDGPWLLHLKSSCSKPQASASTLVPVNRTTFNRAKTEVLREPATQAQVDAALAALPRSQS
jgi:hypothetical protein